MVGLMYRKGIGRNEGMLFPLKIEGVSSAAIMMLNMKFAIDVVWLDSSCRVVDFAKGLKPSGSLLSLKTYSPKTRARYVLELNAGAISRLGIKEKEKIALS